MNKNRIGGKTMKSVLRSIWVLLVMIMFFSVILSACANKEPENTNNMVELSKEIEIEIKQTHLDYLLTKNGYQDTTIDDIYIQKYYGTYNGCVVVMIQDKLSGVNGAIKEATIADVKFYYGSGNISIQIWKEQKFYELQSAYDQGLLTKEDLKKIAAIQNQ